MKISTRFLIGALVAGLSLSLSAADWPQFFGPTANGISPETGINKDWKQKAPTLAWSVPAYAGGFAGPAVAGGVVYIMDRKGGDEVVRALDLATGTNIWQFAYASGGKDNYGFAKSTPVIDNGRIYTAGQVGQVHCLDAKTGEKIWAHDLVADFGGQPPQWNYAASPLVDGDKVILSPGAATIAVAVNKNTGEVIWKSDSADKAGYATPAVATLNGKRQYLIFSGTRISGVDPDNGKALWSFPWKTGYDVHAAMPIAVENSVFINSGYGHGCALVDVAGDKATARWESKAIISRFTTPIFADGYAYCTGEQNGLVCMDLKTGKEKWKQPGFEWGGILAVEGALIVVDGGSGEIAMVRLSPDRYEELGRMKGPGGAQSWTAPILADGKLIVRNKQTLACYNLK
jgi:outer membrane protein assembly factor BamB